MKEIKMKNDAGLLCFVTLLTLFIGTSVFGGGGITLKYKNWETDFSATGDLQNTEIAGKNILSHAAFIMCDPVSESGKMERIFLYASDWNSSANKTRTEKKSQNGKEIIESQGFASKKGISRNEDIFKFKNIVVVTPGGLINIRYEIEFLQTLKWEGFYFATNFTPYVNDVKYTEIPMGRKPVQGLFPASFVEGEIESLSLDLPELGKLSFAAEKDAKWLVEDTRLQGGGKINLYIIPAWFKKGIIFEKGRKETFEVSIQLPVKGAQQLEAFAPINANAPKIENKAKAQNTAPSPGPGQLIPVMDTFSDMDTFSEKINHANPLFLRNMPRQRWWNEKWEQRIPLIVAETVNKKRTNLPVTLEHKFPKNVSPESIRVVTPGNEVIPSQTEIIDKEKNIFRITFMTTLAKNENLPLFIYNDNKDAQKPEYDTILKLKEDNVAYTVYNRRILVEFYKEPRPRGGIIKRLELLNSDGRNRVRNFMDTSGGFCLFKKGSVQKWKVKASGGNLFKEIEYSAENISVKFRIFGQSDQIYYRITGGKDTFNVSTNCLPMGDELHDSAYYETVSGVKKFPLDGLGYNRKSFNLSKYLKEGWLCIADDRGEALGQIFDPKRSDASVRQAEDGNSIILSEQVSPQGTKGALILAMGGFAEIMKRYIDWKNPPELIVGSPQSKNEYSAITTDKHSSKKFANSLYAIELGNYPFSKDNIDSIINYIVDEAIRKNASCIAIKVSPLFLYISWPSKVFHNEAPFNGIMGKLVKLAHEKGIDVEVSFTLYHTSEWSEKRLLAARISMPEGVSWGCTVGDKQFYIDLSKELTATGIDALGILDEYQAKADTEHYKREFEKRYGMKLPDKFSYKELKKPEHYNKVFYDMDLITELVRDMSKAAKSVNSGIEISHTSSPSNNLRALVSGYHDLEAQSDFVDYVFTDPYTTNVNSLKYTCKLCRAASNNRAPLHTWVGWSHYTESEADPDFFRRETLLHILAGGNKYRFAGMSMSDEELPEVATAMRKTAAVLNYTGLGDLIAASAPMKYIGIFRDRNAFIDSIKNGECQAKYSLTDYDKRVDEAIQMRNVPIDIIFSKYFNLQTLSPYPIIIIPSDRVLKDEYAKVAEEYVKQGGILIVQGETATNKTIAELCGVVPTGITPSGIIKLKGLGILENESKSFVDAILNVKAKGEILATNQNGNPLITSSKYGKGKTVFIAVLNSWPFLREIAKSEVGSFPLDVSEELYSNVFVSGDSYIVGVYNPNYKKTFSGRIKINFPLKNKTKAIDVMGGRILPITSGIVDIEIPPEGINYYIISPDEQQPVPAYSPYPQNSAPTYAEVSGMNFLRKEGTETAKVARKPKDSRFLYFGIYNAGDGKEVTGWLGIKDSFKEYSKYVKVDLIDKLDMDTLNYYDAVIVPGMRLPKSINKDWKECLREYVENGGGVFLVHNSIGPCGTISEPVFPEIGKATGNSLFKEFKIVADDSIIQGKALRKHCAWDVMNPGLDVLFQKAEMKTGDVSDVAYIDHLEIEPGSSGDVLAMNLDENGNIRKPVLVAGKLGKGKVVLCGMLMGATHAKGTEWGAEEKIPGKGELGILINSAFWLGGK
ncbi:MAG: hypothetical protein A2020_09865 [Lentisphaerae bacterium GWF2_45_14]|nr:MAG: hypothetical protein A2020_09865 [Lentisphaerae bacterium GWF2_45_14]